MRIAIFDEGVNEVSSIKIKGGYNFRDNNINCIQENQHGTSAAYIINKLNPEAELYSIVLPAKNDIYLDNETIEALCKGIEWCIDNKIKIINMSIGFNIVNEKINTYLKKAYENGIIIVCSAGNKNQTNVGCFPACSLYTISVSNYNPEIGDLDKTSSTGNYVDFASIGVLEGINANGDKIKVNGTSYSAPYLTGIISLMEDIELLNTEQVVESLKQKADRDKKYGYGLVTEVPNKIIRKVNNYNDKATFKYNTHIIKYGESIPYEVEGNLKYNINSIDEKICSVGLGDKLISKAIGSTYIILEDIYGRKSFTHVIVSATEKTKAYNETKVLESNDPGFNFKALGIEKLHKQGIKGKGVKIGLINFGIKDFMDLNIAKVKNIYNGTSYNTEPYVTWDTLVCSKTLGIAPESEIHSIKTGDSSTTWANAKKAIDYCIANKLDIVFLTGIKEADASTVLNSLGENNIIAIGTYMNSYNTAELTYCNNKNYLKVGYVDNNNKITEDNTKVTPIESKYIDCLSYGYGIKSYDKDGNIFTIPETWYQVHNYRNITAVHQVIGIIALMKQQFPNLNTAEKARKLLPYICIDIGYTESKQGKGLLVAKTKEELNLPKDFLNSIK